MTTEIRSAAAFKKVVTVTLPSGLQADLRRPDPERIIMQNSGIMPASLTGELAATLNGKRSAPKAITAEELPQWYTYIDMMIRAALVWPKIVIDRAPDYDAGEIAQEDLEPQDRAYIYQWAMPQGVRDQLAAAAQFRAGAAQSDLAAGANGEAVQPATEPPAGTDG
jgi:hypothetical protein